MILHFFYQRYLSIKQHYSNVLQSSRTALSHGYTLLELSISLSILALLFSGGAAIYAQKKDGMDYKKTLERMDVIEKALAEYVRYHDHLPCPALGSAPDSCPTGTAGGCSSDRYQFGMASTYNSTTHTCAQSAGMVPIQTLNLSQEYAYDGWNRKFTYRVPNGIGPTDFADFRFQGINYELYISDLIGNEQTAIYQRAPDNYGAAYALISHGPNGLGAWTKNYGATLSTAGQFASSREFSNTNHNTRFYIQNDSTYEFDDILRFKQRNHLRVYQSGRSPLQIPLDVCSHAFLFGNTTINTAAESQAFIDVIDQLHSSSWEVINLCYHQPVQCQMSPYDVASDNLIIWLDASRPVVTSAFDPTSDNQAITSWENRVNTSTAATSSGTVPRYRLNVMSSARGNKPAIEIASATRPFELTWDAAWDPLQSFTIMAVFQTSGGNAGFTNTTFWGSGRNIIGYFKDDTPNVYDDMGIVVDDDGKLLAGHEEVNATQHTLYSHMNFDSNFNNAHPHVATFIRDATYPAAGVDTVLQAGKKGRSSLYANGKLLHSLTGSFNDPDAVFCPGSSDCKMTLALSKLYIGGFSADGSTFTNKFEGMIGEFLVFNKALSDEERRFMEGYLIRRWISGECP